MRSLRRRSWYSSRIRPRSTQSSPISITPKPAPTAASPNARPPGANAGGRAFGLAAVGAGLGVIEIGEDCVDLGRILDEYQDLLLKLRIHGCRHVVGSVEDEDLGVCEKRAGTAS